MGNTLYILGNGFDLAHGMKTRYSDFKIYCEKRPPLYHELQKFYGNILNSEGINWWYQFEKSLGVLDYEHILKSEKAILAPNNLLTFLTNHIKIPFAIWLSQVSIADMCKFNLDTEARFFTFNYTDVLEDLYRIPASNIFHVHGRLRNPDDIDNLIVGHNYSERDLFTDFLHRYPNRKGLNLDLVNQLYTKAAEGGKNVSKIIDQNGDYFDSLSSVNSIICIGFSFNNFDMPYLKKIFESNGNQKKLRWQVFYYKKEDGIIIQQQLSSIGIDSSNISTEDVKTILIE